MGVRDTLTLGARLTRPSGFTLDVDLAFEPGITVLFGPSGAGKSTVLDLLAGLVTPDTGRVTLGERVLYDHATGYALPPHRRHLAYVFQGLALFPHMSVLKNVGYGIERRHSRTQRQTLARASLERFAAGHLADRMPGTLSGGEAQRVALARALATEPQAILLDEPFASLDEGLRASFVRELRTVEESLGVPVVHVTHHRGEALALGSRVVRLHSGRVVAVGGAEVLSSEE